MDRITVVGIGAIGSLIAHGLQEAGLEPRLLASPRGIARLRDAGLRIREGGIVKFSRPAMTDDAAALGIQDLVFVCLKEPALRTAAASFAPLIGPDTIVVTMMNGVPWWFAQGLEVLDGRTLSSIDPDGAVETAIPAARCVGCVVYLAASTGEDGITIVGPPGRLVVGDPTKSMGDSRTRKVADMLESCGFKVETVDDIRRATWVKLLGNLTMNPLSALTGATVGGLLDDPDTSRLVRSMMTEAVAVATALRLDVGITVEQRIEALRPLRATKTSMLQDLEAGRVLEVDAIVGTVAELGTMTNVPTPFIDAVLGLVRQRARSMNG